MMFKRDFIFKNKQTNNHFSHFQSMSKRLRIVAGKINKTICFQ